MASRAEFRGGGPYLGMAYGRMVLAERLQRFVEAESVDLECRHGWLPSEGCPQGCFGGKVIPLPAKKPAKRRRKAA